MITDFRKWVTYLGNADTPTYTFPFKIKSVSDIVVVQLDISVPAAPKIDFVERGDVQINVPTVTFDPIIGGGSITFAANLAVGKRIYIKLADDDPTQTVQFREQTDFKLRSIENALDFVVNQTTRLADKSQRSLKFADHFSHVESVVNLEMQEFPMGFGIPIMDAQALQLQMKPILTILADAGVLALITTAQIAADKANTRLDVLEPVVTSLVADIAGQSSSTIINLFSPAGTGAVVDQSNPYFGQSLIFSQGAEQTVLGFLKVPNKFSKITPSQGFVFFQFYTANLTQSVKFQLTTKLIKSGAAVSSSININISSVEVLLDAPAEELRILSIPFTDLLGQINTLKIEKGDSLYFELKRVYPTAAEAAEDVILKSNFTEVLI